MCIFGIGTASPSWSLSSPAMMRNRLDLPDPFRPSTPILAPGKNDSEISLRMIRLGGTTLPTRFIVKTYWAMCLCGRCLRPQLLRKKGEDRDYTAAPARQREALTTSRSAHDLCALVCKVTIGHDATAAPIASASGIFPASICADFREFFRCRPWFPHS